jgi:chemotaxis signal transduction protein
MNASAPSMKIHERLLTFEVGGSIYALPIESVVEVSEADVLSSIPTVPLETAGVMNHHGDALPVVKRSTLLDVEEAELPEPAHVLVIAPRTTGGAQLGMPVDRIVGLVDGAGAISPGADPVAERRPIDGRVVFVLDPRRLVGRAAEAIENSLQRAE